ncbi:hypothetical protein KQI88_10660 [Alkaliphilus sp. MSJ-5]|uniref:Holin-like toxin n=1 Tax=Alkaliphilus flagellatus TaxID=2841507 RepID=A0ABS6G3Y3_9FIRM|nr:putative holin-like toxin [Alkaliphilus flagellatus]MBU5676879.1 hypothetical protein [Alkaliphilus flagellatus]
MLLSEQGNRKKQGVFAISFTKEVVAMTTYETLSLMIAFGMLVVAIVKNNDRKK